MPLALLSLLPHWPLQAAERVELDPAATSVELRLYGLGLLPFDGKYARFRGMLTYDPADQTQCQVELTIDARSLTMAETPIRDEVMGPEFMDTARFPTLGFSGTCQAGSIRGDLAMHGVTHPLALSLEWENHRVTATGRLLRADWGMTGHDFIAGPTVRIQVTVPLSHRTTGGGRG